MNSGRNTALQPPVMFVHIPKTGGMTLNWILAHQYSPEQIFSIDDNHPKESISALAKLLENQTHPVRILKGHFPFGLYGLLPQHLPIRYITILRDPVDRLISHYYFVLRDPNHYLHHQVVSCKMDLKDYVLSGLSTEFDNHQVRAISGVGYSVKCGQCTSEMLECAKQNLQHHFIAIGLTERFDETLLIFKQRLHWSYPLYIKQNVTPNRRFKHEIPQETLEMIEQSNKLDRDLYQFAQKLFSTQIENTFLFQKMLTRFRRYNALYERYMRIKSYVLKK